MSGLTTLVIVAIMGAVAYALGRAVMARLAAAGAAAEKSRRAEADLRAAAIKAEIMTERRSAENVAKDLDAGRF